MLQAARRPQALRRARGAARHRPRGRGRGRLHPRAERLRQEHLAALPQPARAARAGRVFIEGRHPQGAGSGPASRAGLDFVRQRVGMVFQQFNLFPHKTALENVTLARKRCSAARAQEARAKARAAGAGRPRRQARPVPRTAVRRPAAAGRDRPGAGDGPACDALRRGDQRPRPRSWSRRCST